MRTARATGLITALLLAPVALAQPHNVAVAAEAASLTGNPRVFVGSRNPQTGQGDVVATRAQDGAGTAPVWSAASMLDAQPTTARTLLTADATGAAFALDWGRLTAARRDLLLNQGLGEGAISYLRGDRRDEGTASGLRPRASRLGEVVNGNFWLVRSSAGGGASGSTLYVGTGDGMLHGFDTVTGAENLAYVPRGLLLRMADRMCGSDPQPHAVDGPLFACQVPIGANHTRRTVLASALGAGGKGYFVLDASDPATATDVGGNGFVVVDATASTDPDIGHIYSPPVVDAGQAHRSRQIVQLNDKRWATVMGNGYFSARGRPVLLVQYLDGARELAKLSPCVDGQPCACEGGNGLSAPQLTDLNGDGMVDVAYAGDLQGQVWKFGLSANPGGGGIWRVSFAGQPFFTARAPDGQRQPITTAPHWMPHPQGGLVLAVGTGRHLQATDTVDASIQSIYGLRDDSAMAMNGSGVTITDSAPIPSDSIQSRAASLVQQHYGVGRVDGETTYYEASREPVAMSGPQAHRGGWIDLPHSGQRVLQNPRIFEGQKLLVHSVQPVPDANAPANAARVWTAGVSYLSILNMLTGHPPAEPAFKPSDATLPSAAIGMATAPAGPMLQSRVAPSSQQLRYPGGAACIAYRPNHRRPRRLARTLTHEADDRNVVWTAVRQPHGFHTAERSIGFDGRGSRPAKPLVRASMLVVQISAGKAEVCDAVW